MIEGEYPYIKYVLPNGAIFLLTSRPDVYEYEVVEAFVRHWNPGVRFQFTDDHLDRIDPTPNWYWYPWIPGKKLPPELVWAAVSLISREVESNKVIWMHCDSSSMRAPTFFGLYLRAAFTQEQIEVIVKQASWTDGRRQSSPIYYADVAYQLDPGVKELIEAWKYGGEKAAYTQIMHRSEKE